MADGNGSSRRRNALTYWAPLAVTVAVATVGVAAWAWSQRQAGGDDDEEHDGLDYGSGGYAPTTRGGPDAGPAPGGPGQDASAQNDDAAPSWGARVAERLRRTPSPQQVFGTASKTVAAGMAAAGAVMGTALSSIREEDKAMFTDHETWSEEAEKQERAASAVSKDSGKGRRRVVIVVSADTDVGELGDDGLELATILSHIPKNIDKATTKLYILIYAPGLKEGALDTAQPDEGSKSPALPPTTGNPAFDAIYAQALTLVEKETMVLPFNSRNGHTYMLRHLQPEILYLQESLAGDNGSAVAQIQTWFQRDVVLVVGAESGHGGLADSESEAETKTKEEKWWEREDRVGRGRGVVVVDSIRVHDDWVRRVQRRE